MKRRDVGLAAIVFLLVALSINPGTAIANPYLVKPGEPTVRARIGLVPDLPRLDVPA